MELRLAVIAAIVAGTAASASAQAERCASEPRLEDALACYRELDAEAAATARAQLEGAGGPRTELFRAVLLGDDLAAAEPHFRAAIAGFLSRGASREQVIARDAFAEALYREYRYDEAITVLERAVADAGDEARAFAQLRLGLRLQGDQFSRAEALLVAADRAGALVPRDRAELLGELATLRGKQGRYHEAAELTERLAAIGDDLDDAELKAAAGRQRIEWAVAEMELTYADRRPELYAETQELMAFAKARGLDREQVLLLQLSADLSTGPVSQAHYDACRERARELRMLRTEVDCWVNAAMDRRREDPAGTERTLEDVDAYLMPIFGEKVPRVAASQVALYWETGPREKALAASLEFLDYLERSRDRRRADRVRAEAFGNLAAGAFDWIAGVVLAQELVPEPKPQPPRQDIELAFAINERLRAHQLVEALARADAIRTIAATEHPLWKERDAVLGEIAAAQRAIFATAGDTAERAAVLEKLHGLEAAERELRVQLAEQSDSYRRFRAPAPVTIAEVQAQLTPRQAMLSYQISNTENFWGYGVGGSWLIAITRERVTVNALPDELELDPVIDLFSATIDARGDLEREGATRLYRELLAPALAGLSEAIDELVIIPDGALHRLPFAALRPAPDATPLAATHQLSVAPSATLWNLWQRLTPTLTSRVPALILADPDTGALGGDVTVADLRSFAATTSASLGRLPRARQEGRQAADALGGETQLRFGGDAAEAHIKNADLSRYAILHFAAHAVIDLQWPERSGILLAPGAPSEDGLLQARDIAGLALDGQVVLLSGCQTAGGAFVRGEGTMGLARAFLQAGAGAVVATLWKVRDAEISWLVARIYEHLAEGQSIGGAVAGAQRAAITAGVDAASWGSLVVIGDGSLRPRPVTKPPTAAWRLWALSGAGLLALVGLVLLFRRRR